MQAVQESQDTRERAISLSGGLLSADEVGRGLCVEGLANVRVPSVRLSLGPGVDSARKVTA